MLFRLLGGQSDVMAEGLASHFNPILVFVVVVTIAAELWRFTLRLANNSREPQSLRAQATVSILAQPQFIAQAIIGDL